METDFWFGWAIGFFEGEGSVNTTEGHRRLQISSTDLDALQRFHKVVGCGTLNGPYNYSNESRLEKKPRYTWQADSWDGVDLANRMLPYLCSRRQAQVAAVAANPPRISRQRYEQLAEQRSRR